MTTLERLTRLPLLRTGVGPAVSRVLFPSCEGDGHLSGTVVAHRLEQPTRALVREDVVRAAPRHLFGLAPTGGYRAAGVTVSAVGSYPTVSPLPVPLRAIGGLFSVALSVALRRPGVTWRSALWSSDFPRWDRSHRDHHARPGGNIGAWSDGRMDAFSAASGPS